MAAFTESSQNALLLSDHQGGAPLQSELSHTGDRTDASGKDRGLTGGGVLMSHWDAFQPHFLKHVYLRNKFFSEMQSK